VLNGPILAWKIRIRGLGNCSLSENICTIPKATNFTYNLALTVDAPPHREGIENMHWVQIFLLVWLSFGLATVLFMFWLCRRTAASLNDSVKTTSISISPHRAEFSAKKLSGELRSA